MNIFKTLLVRLRLAKPSAPPALTLVEADPAELRLLLARTYMAKMGTDEGEEAFRQLMAPRKTPPRGRNKLKRVV